MLKVQHIVKHIWQWYQKASVDNSEITKIWYIFNGYLFCLWTTYVITIFTVPCANSIITESLLHFAKKTTNKVLRWKHQSTESLMEFLFQEATYKQFCSYKSAHKQEWWQKQTLLNMTTSVCVFLCLRCVFLLFQFVLFFLSSYSLQAALCIWEWWLGPSSGAAWPTSWADGSVCSFACP